MDRPAPRPAPTRLGSGPRGRRGERRDWTRRRGRGERPRACACRQSDGRRDPGRCAAGGRPAPSPPPRLPPPLPREPLESFAKNHGGATAGFPRGWLGSPSAAPHTASPDLPTGSRSDSYTLQGYATTRGPPARARPSEVGEERRLAGGDRALSAGRALAAARRFGRGLRALALGPGPALLVGDLVPLLDDEQIGEAGHGVGDQVEVLVPVAGRVGERLHLVEGKGEGGAVALLRGQAQEIEDPGPADARRASHARPSSRRSIRAASTIERSLDTPTHRGVSQSPQSGTSQRRSAGTCSRASRARSATSAGVSTRKALTSTTPTATSASVGNSLHSSSSLISRLAYSNTNCCTRASRRAGKSGR